MKVITKRRPDRSLGMPCIPPTVEQQRIMRMAASGLREHVRHPDACVATLISKLRGWADLLESEYRR